MCDVRFVIVGCGGVAWLKVWRGEARGRAPAWEVILWSLADAQVFCVLGQVASHACYTYSHCKRSMTKRSQKEEGEGEG